MNDALHELGLRREIVAIVPGFLEALTIARFRSDRPRTKRLYPRRGGGRAGLKAFDLPVTTLDLAISVMSHPRLDADPPHRWLREMVFAVCGAAATPLPEN